MPPSDATELLTALWQAVEHAGRLEKELRSAVDELVGWKDIAQAAIAALERECARRREEDAPVG